MLDSRDKMDIKSAIVSKKDQKQIFLQFVYFFINKKLNTRTGILMQL